MGQLAEVLAVAVADVSPDGPLLGASVDAPVAGRKVATQAFEIGGWVLGRAETADEVEVVLDGTVLARAPVRHPRPDIAEAYEGVEGAASAGFEVVLDASRAPAEAELELRARFGAARISIGTLRLRRLWRGESPPGEPSLVSVVILCEADGEALEQTMASVRVQRYGPTELLIVHPVQLAASAFETWQELGVRAVAASAEGAAALRNEGIRSSNGELVLFIEAGSTLAPEALRHAAQTLERCPQAAGLIDAVADGSVAAAIYRRSAFEELGGFDDHSKHPCDRELARRAAEYDALVEPGALIADPGS
jgi:hypothetical protein